MSRTPNPKCVKSMEFFALCLHLSVKNQVVSSKATLDTPWLPLSSLCKERDPSGQLVSQPQVHQCEEALICLPHFRQSGLS